MWFEGVVKKDTLIEMRCVSSYTIDTIESSIRKPHSNIYEVYGLNPYRIKDYVVKIYTLSFENDNLFNSLHLFIKNSDVHVILHQGDIVDLINNKSGSYENKRHLKFEDVNVSDLVYISWCDSTFYLSELNEGGVQHIENSKRLESTIVSESNSDMKWNKVNYDYKYEKESNKNKGNLYKLVWFNKTSTEPVNRFTLGFKSEECL